MSLMAPFKAGYFSAALPCCGAALFVTFCLFPVALCLGLCLFPASVPRPLLSRLALLSGLGVRFLCLLLAGAFQKKSQRV